MYDASGPATNATNAATSSPFAEVSTLRSAGGFLSDPVRAQIYAEMATSECPLNCSNFREVDNRTLPKVTLSHHFKILRVAGLIRSERKGVEMHNTTRCAELKERFGEMLAAILTTYAAQTSRREQSTRRSRQIRRRLASPEATGALPVSV
jgi:DNA-binding transcriptional ArsR family regulator